MRALLPLSAALLSILPAHADSFEERAIKKMSKMNVEDFRKGIQVTDDDMSTSVTVSSARSFTVNQGILSDTQSDVALRALIHKRTGEVVFQLIGSLGYKGDWRFYELATYMTPEGPKDAALELISRSPNCIGGGICLYNETAFCLVEEYVLRAVASADANWKLRFTPKAGPFRNELMSPLEVRAFLDAVDIARAKYAKAPEK